MIDTEKQCLSVSDAQKLFDKGIKNLNLYSLRIGLENGAMIDQSNSGKNSLVRMIKSLLNSRISQFNIDLIKEIASRSLIKVDINILLGSIIKNSKIYILMNKNKRYYDVMNNITELIKFVSNIPRDKRTITCDTILNAVKTENDLIVETILSGLDSNFSGNNVYVIERAIEDIKNPRIVQLLIECQAMKIQTYQYDKLLELSVLTGDPLKLRELVVHGMGKQHHDVNGYFHTLYPSYQLDQNKFTSLYGACYSYALNAHIESRNQIEQMIKMIMCSGNIVPDELYNRLIAKRNKTYVGRMIIDCYELLKHKRSNPRIESLKQGLIETMDELANNENYKKKIMNEMDNTMHCIPRVCVNIIYEYQYTESKVMFIDWSNY